MYFMIMKRCLIFAAMLCLTAQSFAQNGYSISIDVANAKNKMMTVSYFKGSPNQKYQTDSVLINADKKLVTFKVPDRIIGAIYQLGFKDDPKNTINIAVDNGSNLHFTLDGTMLLLLKSKEKLNKDFILYQTATSNFDQRKEKLSLLVKDYPESSVALFSKFEMKKAEVTLKNPDSAANIKLRDDYFKDIDLQDKRIPLMPNAYSYLFEYMNILPINNDNYQDNVDLLLKNSDCSSRNYSFYLDWIFKNISYYQRYNLTNTYRYVYSMYLDKEVCEKNNEKFYNKMTDGLKALDELPIGSVIPAFDMEDSLGKGYNIQSIYPNSKYTFLSFYDPDCSHCKEIIPKVEAYFEQHKKYDNQLQKVAFINSKDSSKWQSFITTNKLENWLNVRSKKDDTKYLNDLKVYSNPQFFLLNDKGVILLKSFNDDELNAILNSKK
jgi:thiol-disulfide isomerase/thioredoxin